LDCSRGVIFFTASPKSSRARVYSVARSCAVLGGSMHRWVLTLVVMSVLSTSAGRMLAASDCTAPHCVYAPLITMPAPDVIVLRQTIYRGHVIGEMLNTQIEPVRLNTIRVDGFDNQGHLVYSDTSFEHLAVLQAQMISCFTITVPPNVVRIQIARIVSTR